MTPIHKLHTNLNGNTFFVKRDDLLPFSFGGNKARKAVKFLEEIKKNNSDVIVTYGSSSSNHCRVTANMAASENMRCVIISPEEQYEQTSNSCMMELFGAEIVKAPLDRISETIDMVMDRLKETNNPYFIRGGGHGNIGTSAYVEAYKEILEYEKDNKITFDYIFCASGTGTTQAGLVAGEILEKRFEQKIVGISIARKNPYGGGVVLDSVKEYLGDTNDYSEKVLFTDKYICGGYGKYNDEILDTIRAVLVYDGMPLNTTYTGKAFWGMKKYVSDNVIKNKNILFVNTGGTPLFFDRLENIAR